MSSRNAAKDGAAWLTGCVAPFGYDHNGGAFGINGRNHGRTAHGGGGIMQSRRDTDLRRIGTGSGKAASRRTDRTTIGARPKIDFSGLERTMSAFRRIGLDAGRDNALMMGSLRLTRTSGQMHRKTETPVLEVAFSDTDPLVIIRALKAFLNVAEATLVNKTESKKTDPEDEDDEDELEYNGEPLG